MLIFIVFVVIALISLHIGRRLSDLEKQIERVGSSGAARHEFDSLLLRVAALELAGRTRPAGHEPKESGRAAEPAAHVVRAKEEEPEFIRTAPEAATQRIPERAGEEKSFPEPVDGIEAAAPVTVQPVVLPAAPVSAGDRIRDWLGNEEWEALVGGSWLNKIGAVVLVIGIALFLGYSFGHVGPAGRASVSVILSTALLVSGVSAEKRPRFKIFSRGLIGAGWAALYATAYALYAIPATRIIASAFAGSVILLIVSCGMILHSLRYRSQAITGITYFAAFAALAITPATPFAVLSLIPLAASLLYLAWKFDWYSMALFGVAATYLTCMSKGDPNALLAGSQSLLIAYWLLFEAFDLLRMHRRALSGGVEWIFPANALGFLGMSYLAWAAHSPAHLWQAAGYASVLYLASAVVRFQVRPPASFEPDEPLVARLRAGSFEGAALIAAVLAGMAIFGRVTGVWSSFGLALEAEIIFLAGVSFNSVFLRRLGAGGFTISLLALLPDTGDLSRTTVLGHAFRNWSPAALLHAGLFYINREIRRGGVVFSTVAAGLTGMVLAVEFPEHRAGAAWAIFGILLLFTGLHRRLFEFRVQGYALAAGGFVRTAGLSIAGSSLVGAARPWVPLAVCLALASGVMASLTTTKGRRGTTPGESALALPCSAGATILFAFLLTWRVVPEDYLAIAWCFLTAGFLEPGLRRLPTLRTFFLPMAGLTGLGIAATHGADLMHMPPFTTWATYLVACLACITSAIRLSAKQNAESPGGAFARDLICLPAVVCAAILVWLLVPLPLVSLAWVAIALSAVGLFGKFRVPVLVQLALGQIAIAHGRVLLEDLQDSSRFGGVPVRFFTIPLFIAALCWLRACLASVEKPRMALAISWSALVPFLALTLTDAGYNNLAVWWAGGSLALLICGTLRDHRDFRPQGYCLAGLSLLCAVWFDLSPARLPVSIPVVAVFYFARFVLRRIQDRRPPMYFSLAATTLLAAILYNSISGHMLTVAWGVEGLILLGAGFALRDRLPRLQGLALLLVCTLKLFLYDLRNLDTPYRILSFIALGLILLSVSWTYSRFREQVRKIL